MCGAGVVADGRIFIGFRGDVLENLESALHLYGHHHQQKGELG